MTLIMAMGISNSTGDYIVFGCDSRGMIGRFKTNTEVKVFPLNKYSCVLIAGDGEIGSELIQRFKTRYKKNLNESIENIAENFSKFCRNTYKNFGRFEPKTAKDFPDIVFILAGLDKKGKNKFEPKLYILRSESMFCHSRKKDYCAEGRSIIALYLLQKKYEKDLQIDNAYELVGEVLYETKQIDSMVGGRLKIGAIDKDGFHIEPDPFKFIKTWDEQKVIAVIKE